MRRLAASIFPALTDSRPAITDKAVLYARSQFSTERKTHLPDGHFFSDSMAVVSIPLSVQITSIKG
jgi:hypothetical protein